MEDVIATALAMGADIPAIERWLDMIDPAAGVTPREAIAAGRIAEVLEALERMDEGVFA